MMPYLDGMGDLPVSGSVCLARGPFSDVQKTLLGEAAIYLRSATPSSIVLDAAGTAWKLLVPSWLHRRRQVRRLEKTMREVSPRSPREPSLTLQAPNFETYEAAALQLDDLQGHNDWKAQFESMEEDYNPRLIRKQMRRLQKAVKLSDIARLQFLLRTQLSRSMGGMNILRLYKHSWHGTKDLVNDYIATVVSSITSLLELTDRANLPPHEARFHQKSLEDALRYLGRSALTLSGGAKLGMKHVGVVKALWQADLLPNIISGASAGAIVAAIIGAHSDSELQHVLDDFPYSDLAVFDPPHIVGTFRWCMSRLETAYRIHAWFDMRNLERVMKEWLGSMTFKEAHNKTGRTINICISSPDSSDPRLLNYTTAPNVYLWSAVCASCSVPYVFQPANIYERDVFTGRTRVWSQGFQQWVDGSLDSDIPQRKLSEMFNVNYFIVSQVNPHVRPFLAAEEIFTGCQPTLSTPPSPLYHSFLTFLKTDLIHRFTTLSSLPPLRPLLRGLSILTQKYTGDINIHPALHPADYTTMMSNPTPAYMLSALSAGQRATWPKLPRIRNDLAIELALLQAIHTFRDRVNFGPQAARARELARIDSLRGRQRRLKPRRPSFDGRKTASETGVTSSHYAHDLTTTPAAASAVEPKGMWDGDAVESNGVYLGKKRNRSAGSLIERLGSLAGLTPLGGPNLQTSTVFPAPDGVFMDAGKEDAGNGIGVANGNGNGNGNGFSFSLGSDEDWDSEADY